MALEAPKNKFYVSDIAQMLDIPDWDKIEDMNQEYIWESRASSARKTSDDDFDERRMKAEQEVSDELYQRWYNAVESAANSLFNEHKLELVEKSKKFKGGAEKFFEVEPLSHSAQGWKEAAQEIVNTINGVGMFEFNSVKEFIDSGPYGSAKNAVLHHLHWIKHWPEVYGDYSARRRFDRAFGDR
jgi:hypothetical protein